MNRRDVLAGAAALPALGLPAAAETDDPAVGAARRWLAAWEAERSFAYSSDAWDDNDPQAVALSREERRLWDEMLDTPPTTAAGFAMMLAAFVYETEGQAVGANFGDPETWYLDGEGDGASATRILPVLWRSPAAAALFGRAEA